MRIVQWILAGFAAEASLLARVRERMALAGVLVTFNGKSFDLPLLKARARLAGTDIPTDGLAHVDLLHVTRRLLHAGWPDCRLRTAEARALRLERTDDLPGAEAPPRGAAGSSGAMRACLGALPITTGPTFWPWWRSSRCSRSRRRERRRYCKLPCNNLELLPDAFLALVFGSHSRCVHTGRGSCSISGAILRCGRRAIPELSAADRQKVSRSFLHWINAKPSVSS